MLSAPCACLVESAPVSVSLSRADAEIAEEPRGRAEKIRGLKKSWTPAAPKDGRDPERGVKETQRHAFPWTLVPQYKQ